MRWWGGGEGMNEMALFDYYFSSLFSHATLQNWEGVIALQ